MMPAFSISEVAWSAYLGLAHDALIEIDPVYRWPG